jgi:predicted outer membrane protein
MKNMVMNHRKDVAEFKHESTAAHNPGLKNWVSETLPTPESHLQEAEKIAPQTNTSARGKNSVNKGATTAQKL